jgi:hypothetical protein
MTVEAPRTTDAVVVQEAQDEMHVSPTSSSIRNQGSSVADYGATFRGRKRDALSGRRMREIRTNGATSGDWKRSHNVD